MGGFLSIFFPVWLVCYAHGFHVQKVDRQIRRWGIEATLVWIMAGRTYIAAEYTCHVGCRNTGSVEFL